MSCKFHILKLVGVRLILINIFADLVTKCRFNLFQQTLKLFMLGLLLRFFYFHISGFFLVIELNM